MAGGSTFYRGHGFTLIELMVTIAIGAILMVVAVPGFQSFQRSSAVFSAASSFASALNTARAEAIKEGRPVIVRPATGTNWTTGWIAFVDVNGDGTYAASDGDILLLQQASLPPGVTTPTTTALPGFVDTAGAVYVRYNQYGNPTVATMTMPRSIDFTASSGSNVTTRRVILNAVGRARTCDPIPPQNQATCVP